MSVQRQVRHTKPVLRQETREKVLYKPDMEADGAGVGTWYNTPIFSFADGADNYVTGDIKIPKDRVKGTPIQVRPVISVIGAAGGQVVLRLDYYTVGIGESMADLTEASNLQVESVEELTEIVKAEGFKIPASELDYRPGGNIQFELHADRTDPSDTNTGTLYLLKLIFQYTAYC